MLEVLRWYSTMASVWKVSISKLDSMNERGTLIWHFFIVLFESDVLLESRRTWSSNYATSTKTPRGKGKNLGSRVVVRVVFVFVFAVPTTSTLAMVQQKRASWRQMAVQTRDRP